MFGLLKNWFLHSSHWWFVFFIRLGEGDNEPVKKDWTILNRIVQSG